MNGNTTMAALGGDLAAKKGILVFVAAGNDGNSAWHFIISPADGDSVVAVGAVNATGTVGSFSSYGPSSDGQIKPEMASVGVSALIQSTSNIVVGGNGTSFACPNMAGLGSCLWQGFPEYNNMKIVQALKESATKFTTPDDRVGYGIPNVKTAFTNLLKEYATATTTISNCTATINWRSKDVQAMKYEIERKAPGDSVYIKLGEQTSQAGLVLANRSYQFSNSITGLPAGIVSYRIKQIIDTAAASFSFIYIFPANANIQIPCKGTDRATLAPNPTRNNTTLIVETNYAVPVLSILVYDMKGSLVMNIRKTKGAGVLSFDIPSERLAAGKYIIKAMNGKVVIGQTNLLKL
jgi:hypothetical protein